jgi:UDP-N-acetylglucosamine 2-epimerase (non-hydrolysing)
VKKILIVVGTRPNFIKVTRFKQNAAHYNFDIKIVHTGQHYDTKMADVFFEQFRLVPDYFLNIAAGSPNSQMAEIMLGLEKTIAEYNPQLLMVVGDVNSTLAAALTANKLNIPLAHLESGLRSGDRSMPEEINRILTDEITDYFFVTEQSGIDNLKKEGKKSSAVFFVGNSMIDTIVAYTPQIERSDILERLGIANNEFVLMTIHRPATVDVPEEIAKLLGLIEHVSVKYKIVFPVHPRTIGNLKKYGLYERFSALKGVIATDPLDYFAFQKLVSHCRFILTDSGGIQEESTFRQKPCITLRPNTERPSTVDAGTNTLLPFDPDLIQKTISAIENGTYKAGRIPEKWDGHTTERVLEVLAAVL